MNHLHVLSHELCFQSHLEIRPQVVRWQPRHAPKLNLLKTPLQALKKVSGSLTRLLRSRDKSTATTPPAIRRLLVVDDEQSICFSLSDYFTHHGFTVDTASDIEHAEQLIATTAYEVLIQDLRLSDSTRSDGIDVIKLIHERNPETRIVVLTSYGSGEMEEEARRSGADAFLRKPKPLSQVAQVVEGLIESPRARSGTNSVV
jgi:ActR/RegA family two-component response regulator